MTIEFFMPMIPPSVTAQERRIGRRKDSSYYTYDDAKIKDARSKLMSALYQNLPEDGAFCDEALALSVQWLFPTGKKHKNGEWKVTVPDTDNLNKMLKDCMTDVGFWDDDCRVCVEHVEKRYADVPGIRIRIKEL